MVANNQLKSMVLPTYELEEYLRDTKALWGDPSSFGVRPSYYPCPILAWSKPHHPRSAVLL